MFQALLEFYGESTAQKIAVKYNFIEDNLSKAKAKMNLSIISENDAELSRSDAFTKSKPKIGGHSDGRGKLASCHSTSSG